MAIESDPEKGIPGSQDAGNLRFPSLVVPRPSAMFKTKSGGFGRSSLKRSRPVRNARFETEPLDLPLEGFDRFQAVVFFVTVVGLARKQVLFFRLKVMPIRRTGPAPLKDDPGSSFLIPYSPPALMDTPTLRPVP